MANAPWIAVSLKLGVVFLPLISVIVAGVIFLTPPVPPAHQEPVKPPPIHVVARVG